MYKRLVSDITVAGTSVEILGLDFSDTFRNPVAKCTFETSAATINWLGGSVSASIGLNTATHIFSGYVTEIDYTRLPGVYKVTASNILDKAQKYYIVTSSLDQPWTRENISAENLVRDLLGLAGITNYYGWTSGFTFGVNSKVEFNLISVLDAIGQINNILATEVYAIEDTVYWAQTQPIPGTPIKTYSNFVGIDYTYGTKNLRNKVVVFGPGDVYAEASAVSPYLPQNFYQTAIVSSELIDQQSMAEASANYNLNLYNKLTEELRLEIEGDPTIHVRDTVTVSNTHLGADGNWFVYSLKHDFSNTFITTLFLRR